MWLIAGLGNPGGEYAGTRHNLGYEVVELLGRRWGLPLDRGGFDARYGKGPAPDGGQAVLLQPLTFMNRSGQAVAAAMAFFKVQTSGLIVVLDDLALPVGQVRLRTGGSAGGHKGLADIIARLGREDIARVRIGIGAVPPDWTGRDYVLSRPTPQERTLLDEAVAESADAVGTWVLHGAEAAMNRYNRSGRDPTGRTTDAS